MNFYNKIIQYNDSLKALIKELESFDLKQYWSGPANDKFSLMIDEVKKISGILVEHFKSYETAGIRLKKLEETTKKLSAKKTENASLQIPNPSLELEIKALENEKNNLITLINEEFEKISAYAISSLIANNITISNSTYGTINTNQSLNNVSNNNTTNNNNISSIQTISTSNSNQNYQNASSKVNEGTGDVTKTNSNISNSKVLPQSVDDIDLGSGKYMTDADWANSPYISKEEFRCQCGGRYCDGYPAEISKTLVEDLNKIRVYYGKPIVINSGLRCNTHNKNIGGAKDSSHKTGRAVDIVIEGVNAYDLLDHIKTNYNEHNGYSYTGSSSGYSGMDGVVHFGVKDIER